MTTSWYDAIKTLQSHGPNANAFLAGCASSQSTTRTLDLDASDDRYAFVFLSPDDADLTDIWIAVDSYNGTWSNTDQLINLELWTGQSSNFTPNGSPTALGTIDLSSSPTGWVHLSGLSQTLTRGQAYYVSVYDSDGDPTDHVTMVRDVRESGTFAPFIAGSGVYTTGAWASGNASANYPTPCIVKIGDFYLSGAIWSSISTQSSNTNERGNKLTPPEPVSLAGFVTFTDAPASTFSADTWKLYADGVNPGGSTLKTWTPPNPTWSGSGPPIAAVWFDEANWYDLEADTTYRFVMDPVSNRTTPRAHGTFANDDATVRSILQGPLQLMRTVESGGVWSDSTNEVTSMFPILIPRSAAGGGGGNANLLRGKL